MILDYFDKAYYINLDKRVDRKLEFESRVKSIGLDVERWPATQLNKTDITNNTFDENWHIKVSCTYSHQQLINNAKEKGYKSILIFEDDCVFENDFVNKAKECINELKKLEWDIFYFGGEPNEYCKSISERLAKTDGCYSTHAYAINHTFYDKILSTPYYQGVIDMLYMHYPANQKLFYISKELLAWQDMSASDLWLNKNVNTKTYYQNSYNKFINEKS
jgi:GR25 family glycosyltransferase involved in LPS biosynthesis